MDKKRISISRILLILVLVCVLAVGGMAGVLVGIRLSDRQTANQLELQNQALGQQLDAVLQQNAQMIDYLEESQKILYGVNSSLMATTVDMLLAGLESDKEKVLAVVSWVAANISNRPLDEYVSGNIFGWYGTRSGLCAERSYIAVEMLKLHNIYVRHMRLYDFPDATDGHSAIEAYYNDRWHYFDVTYAGYFEVDGVVLSFEEIMGNPARALAGMVVLEQTIDRSGYDENGMSTNDYINNAQRMREVYSMAALSGFRSYGLLSRNSIVPICPQFSLTVAPLVIGAADASDADVESEGRQAMLSANLHYALSRPTPDPYNLQTEWNFTDCTPGTTYYIEYTAYGATDAGLAYYVIAEGANVTTGGTYETSQDLVDGQAEVWRIEFVPESPECSLRIGFDFTDLGVGAWVDCISVGSAA